MNEPPSNNRAAVFVAGASFVAGWSLADGAYQVWRQPDGNWLGGVLGIGTAAPLWPAAGLIALGIHEAWRRAIGAERPLVELVRRARAWLGPGAAVTAVERTAWMLAGLIALALWAAGSITAGANLARQIRTPGFLGAAMLAVNGALALALVAAIPALATPLHWTLRRLVRRRPALGRWMTPAWVLRLVGFGALTGVGAAWVLHGQVMVHLPWNLAAGALAGSLLARVAAGGVMRLLGPGRSVIILLITSSAYGWAGTSPRLAPPRLVQPPSLIAISQRLWRSQPLGIEQPADQALDREVERYREGKLAHPLPPDVQGRPHILLVTTDSLSFPHTTLGGYRRDTTPRLASWARRATVFPTAFSLSAATRTGFPGLIAGIFNAQAELRPDRTPPFPYAETMTTTAALLRAQGYRTVHIPGDRFFLGNGRGWHTVGFEVVDDACTRAGDPIHTAPEITAAAIRHIDAQPAGQPLFLWVHYFDHHIPFQLGPGIEPFDEQRGKVDRYDAEIRFADAHWGRLLEHVERVWAPDRYLAIFTGDHGESFDANHPDKHHSGSILTSVLHVPLVIQAAERRGHTVGGLVSHADILPTIANVLGLEPDRRWVGSSLAAVLFAGAEVERDVLYSLRFAPELYQRRGAGFLEIGVRTSRHYLIHDLELGAARLVDWRNDPLERDDRSAAEPAEYARLRHLARRKLAWLEARACGLKYPACP